MRIIINKMINNNLLIFIFIIYTSYLVGENFDEDVRRSYPSI